MTQLRALAAAAAIAIVFAASPSANHYLGFHWARTDNPFTLDVGDNVTGAWQAALQGAVSDWSKSRVLNLAMVAGGTRPKSCRATDGRIEVCNERYGRTRWLGVATIWAFGEHIVKATTRVNDTYFSPTYAGGYYDTDAWRQYVMCQEVGHDLGLDHQDENFDNAPLGTCMDYTDPPEGSTQPDAHDYAELEDIYAHLDATTTVGQILTRPGVPPAMDQINFEGPEQWGRLVRSSVDGRLQKFELDFGNGNRVITYVIWAEPRG